MGAFLDSLCRRPKPVGPEPTFEILKKGDNLRFP